MDLQFYCEELKASPRGNGRTIDVEMEVKNTDQILKHFKIADVINYFGAEALLNEIGIDEVKKHFDLVDAE